MHFVECGPEPPSLGKLRNLKVDWNTAAQDPLYKPFMEDFSEKFSWFCGYCERACTWEGNRKADNHNTVDHFRPKGNSRYRSLAFEWDNLVYACYRCGQAKLEKFPGLTDEPVHGFIIKLGQTEWGKSIMSRASRVYGHPFMDEGYVNPRNQSDWVEGEESWFVFDERGFILPNDNLDDQKWSKALRTIVDLDLNPDFPIGQKNLVEQRRLVAKAILGQETSKRQERLRRLEKGGFISCAQWAASQNPEAASADSSQI